VSAKNLLFVFLSLFCLNAACAREDIDSVIKKAASDITERCSAKAVLAIDDFESPAKKITLYVREQLADAICEESRGMKIVTRERMDKIERELRFQNSGVVSEKTIVSAAERLGASYILFGKLEEYKSGCSLLVRMLDVKTGAYLFRRTYQFQYSQKAEQLLERSPSFKKTSLAIFCEANKNSIESIAPAAGLSFDYAFCRKLSAGAKIAVSHDIHEKENKIFALETLAAFRWYFASLSGEPVTGFFVEAQAGAAFLLVNSELRPKFDGGAGMGCRFAFGGFYLEPEIRFGYPYVFGAGIAAGMRF